MPDTENNTVTETKPQPNPVNEHGRQRYYYQQFKWSNVNWVKRPDKSDAIIFLDRISLRGHLQERFVENNKLLLYDFETHILGNIHWYEKKIVKEKTLRMAYIFISLSLLLVVPILVALINEFTESVSAQVTAVFTGFFALYQGVSKWLESRNVISNYWQTSSNLKSRLYSLEDKWKYINHENQPWSNNLLTELRDDLRKAVRYGIDCLKAEKQLFFENYSYPQFNILGSILGVRTQVNQLFGPGKKDRAESSETTITHPRHRLAALTEVADEPTSDRTGAASLEEQDKHTPPIADPLVPNVVLRASWGARKPLKKSVPLGDEIKSLIIHHAAGFWDGQISGKRQVQAIQMLHQSERTDGNGNKVGPWNDIGYHFLVDPNGVIYQGREFLQPDKPLMDKPTFVMGAHAGGSNTGRVGICLLGDFHKQGSGPPTEKAMDSLIELIAWLAHTYKPVGDDRANVKGEIIAGHRDYSSTSCPGDKLYALIEELRLQVPVS